MKIGDTIWRFDENRREYAVIEGKRFGRPIYRSHWRPCKVTNETTRSWVTEFHEKAPKRGVHPGWAFTEEEVDDDVWQNSHRYSVQEAIRKIDVPTLRKVAALIGWKEPQ